MMISNKKLLFLSFLILISCSDDKPKTLKTVPKKEAILDLQFTNFPRSIKRLENNIYWKLWNDASCAEYKKFFDEQKAGIKSMFDREIKTDSASIFDLKNFKAQFYGVKREPFKKFRQTLSRVNVNFKVKADLGDSVDKLLPFFLETIFKYTPVKQKTKEAKFNCVYNPSGLNMEKSWLRLAKQSNSLIVCNEDVLKEDMPIKKSDNDFILSVKAKKLLDLLITVLGKDDKNTPFDYKHIPYKALPDMKMTLKIIPEGFIEKWKYETNNENYLLPVDMSLLQTFSKKTLWTGAVGIDFTKLLKVHSINQDSDFLNDDITEEDLLETKDKLKEAGIEKSIVEVLQEIKGTIAIDVSESETFPVPTIVIPSSKSIDKMVSFLVKNKAITLASKLQILPKKGESTQIMLSTPMPILFILAKSEKYWMLTQDFEISKRFLENKNGDWLKNKAVQKALSVISKPEFIGVSDTSKVIKNVIKYMPFLGGHITDENSKKISAVLTKLGELCDTGYMLSKGSFFEAKGLITPSSLQMIGGTAIFFALTVTFTPKTTRRRRPPIRITSIPVPEDEPEIIEIEPPKEESSETKKDND